LLLNYYVGNYEQGWQHNLRSYVTFLIRISPLKFLRNATVSKVRNFHIGYFHQIGKLQVKTS